MRPRSSWFLITGALLALGLGTGGSVRADLINGGFESGDLTGWTLIGTGSVETLASSGVAPVEGAHQALIRTGLDVGVAAGDLETALGLAPGTLDGYPGASDAAFNGSAIVQTFTAEAGDFFSGSFNLLSNDVFDPGLDFPDYVFAVVDGLFLPGPNLNVPFGGPIVPAPPESGFFDMTGYTISFGWTFGTAGSHTIAFGIVDVNDDSIEGITDSGVMMDAFELVPIPEPASLALLGLGLTAALALRRPGRTPAIVD